jgi:hypothetical protein
MVAVQLAAIREDLVGESVQVLDLPREPRHRVLVVLVEAGDDLAVARGLLDLIQSRLNLPGVLVQLHHELIAGESGGGARLNMQQVDLVFLEDLQRLGKGPNLLT